MRGEGRIAEHDTGSLAAWNPESVLREVSAAEARYSRGFLCARPQSWFAGLGDQWLVLFHTLGADVAVSGVERRFDPPADLWRVSAIEVDSEPALIGFSRSTFDLIGKYLAPEANRRGTDVAVEYIERRLISSLERTWSGEEPMQCLFCGAMSEEEAGDRFAAYLGMHFLLGGESGTVWFAIGQQLLERLDVEWRRKILFNNKGGKRLGRGDHVHSISIEIAELAVPPAMLIDYMRKGTVVDLETPVSDSVAVKVNGEHWAEGRLCRMRELLAVEISDLNAKPRVFPESTTRVRIEIAQTELDDIGLREHAQPGAILLTDTQVGPNASLIIGGENVASAVVGELSGNFAINILGK